MQILNLQQSSVHKKNGFTSVELMLASLIFLSLIGIAFKFTTSSLRVESRESQIVDLQQNIRSAMQLITQDIRSSSGLHFLNTTNCQTGQPCSTANQISIISADGNMTLVAETPGVAYNNSNSTRVCDARDFGVGDTALVFNVSDIGNNEASYDFLDIVGVNIQANRNSACSPANSDIITHNQISGTWTNNSYISRSTVATYFLGDDPVHQGKTALFRRTGIATQGQQSGLVSFGVTNLSIGYGVRVSVNPTATVPLVFYPSLQAAAAALGPPYSAVVNTPGTRYVGDRILAIRVTLEGESEKDLAVTRASNQDGQIERAPSHFSLSQTVQLRRNNE